ncbi:dienelactone hydrolase family protein [soil metagenome]
MRSGLIIALVMLLPVQLFGAIKTQTVEYKDGDVTCKGYLAYDDAIKGARPGVLVVPEWWGLTDYAKHRAEQLAQLGFVAFAADMYGNGKTTDDPKDAGALATPLKTDPAKFRARGMAAIEAMKSSAGENLDVSRMAAIGYCFGGSAVLELARGGADLLGVVSFHGGLAAHDKAKAGDVKAKVLVCTGADDAFVKPEEVNAFEQEMKAAGVDYSVISYGGAVHAFSNPDADRHNIPNIAYNEKADLRSWEAMKAFFLEIFKK